MPVLKLYYTINRGLSKLVFANYMASQNLKTFRRGLLRLKVYQFSSNKRKDGGTLLWPFEDMHSED